jgi:hypothetical protein
MNAIRLFHLVVILTTYSDAELQFHKLTHEWINPWHTTCLVMSELLPKLDFSSLKRVPAGTLFFCC